MDIVDLFENKVAYYMTPKCGSRTIFAWGALIKEPDLIIKNREWFKSSAKGDLYSKIAKKLKFYTSTNHDQEVRFCIVRDPVDRFLSGFTNRILYHRDLKSTMCVSEFIKNFDDIMQNPKFKSAALHFYPQANSIGDNPNLYTHIYKLSEMNKIKALLEEYCGMYLPDLHMQQSGGIQKPMLTEEQVAWIKKRYEIDYRIYEKWMV